MKKVYSMNDSAAKKHVAHLLKLLAISGAMALAALLLGLKRWTTGQYVWVNILLLGMLVFCVNALAHFGGRFDGKDNKAEASKKFLIISGAAAAAFWLILTIAGTPLVISGFIFIADLLMAISLCLRFWEMLKNTWKGLGGEIDKNGKPITYPGEIVLHEVHTSDALTSPFGKVLIYKNAFLFVLPELNHGIVIANPNGTLELKKTAYFNDNKIKETKLSASTIMSQARDGAERVIRIVEEECAKNNIPVPEMIYNYVLYLPNFERGNVVWDMDSFRSLASVHFWNEEKKYDQYLKNAAQKDYFNGRACYEYDDLKEVLEMMNVESEMGDEGAREKGELIASILAKACQLEEKA